MRYSSDLTDKQWEIIAPIIGKPGNKSKHPKRELVNAVLYLIRTGCQWRNLPKDFPKWQTVYTFYKRAKESNLWERILEKLVKETRIKAGRNPNSSLVLIDSQSVKTVYNSEKRSIDGGKKDKGKKAPHSD